MNRGRWSATTVVVLVMSSGLIVSEALADGRECRFVDQRWVCTNVAPGGERDGEGARDGPASPLGTWKLIAPYEGQNSPLDCADADGNPVLPLVLVFRPADPGADVVARNVCPSDPLPPPPPSPEEAWRAAPIPPPDVHINPGDDGATGIESWLWGEDLQALPVSVPLRGYVVSGVARPMEWRWHMGDNAGTANPDPLLVSDRPGSEENPAALYTYETKGDYTVTHSVVWGGRFTVRGFGLELTADAGRLRVETSRPYHVVEIRAVRTPVRGT